jgi:hypothetical protein
MTALTTDRSTPYREGDLVSDPLADGATIYAGGLYALDAAGNAVAATADGNPVRAVALHGAESGLGDGLVRGRRGCWRFANGSGTAALGRTDIGGVAYVIDDQTVGKTGTAVAGLVLDIEDDEVWLQVGAASSSVQAASA